jgi:hypothetical protein
MHMYHLSPSMLLNLSTSTAEPMQSGVRWSMPSIWTSRMEPPLTPSDVRPPAASTYMWMWRHSSGVV